MKKQRFDSPGLSGPSAPSSPTHAAHTLASFAQQQVLSPESICPFSILQQLVDDYFAYVHPLIPVPHEPSFRAALDRWADHHSPTFLALLASMIGCLVASFPQRSLHHIRAHNVENLFPNSMSLVERCHKITIEARGPAYLDRKAAELSVHDAIISYLQSLIGAYTFDWTSCRVYLGQCLTISRIIGLHRSNGLANVGFEASILSMSRDGNDIMDSPNETRMDLLSQELSRRTFWLIFVAVKWLQQLGISCGEFNIPPSTRAEPYPPLPLEIDDAYLTPTHIIAQSTVMISELVGFNANVRVFSTYDTLSTVELAYGVGEVFDWDRQKRILKQALTTVKCVLEGIPAELDLLPVTRSDEPQSQRYPSPQVFPPHQDRGNPNSNGFDDPTDERRKVQHQIQKANIHASQLGTRLHLVDKYWQLHQANERASPGNGKTADSSDVVAAGLGSYLAPTSDSDLTQHDVAIEGEAIVKDLVAILNMISHVDVEAYGVSFILKIRQIACTLLNMPQARKGQLALHADHYIQVFLEILKKLERMSPAGDARVSEEDDEVQMRQWTELRDYQARFAHAGSLLSEL